MSVNVGIGKVYTYRKQEPINIGNGVFVPDNVFMKLDSNGKIIVDDIRCKIVRTQEEAQIRLVKIGNKTYKSVRMPDGKFWLAENLSTVFEGINISSETSTDPNMTFVDNVAYYNGYCIDVINEALADKGWRVASLDDWGELGSASGISISNFGKYIKTAKYNGIDAFGFSAECLGSYTNGEIRYFGEQGYFWTSTEYKDSTTELYAVRIQTSQDKLEQGVMEKNSVFTNIRLVSI